ncbi:hypothetical protein SBOR_3495 [Sclerotinia borealis F-4128]|uniref:Uncharacterized protein n=1 Tax=Sclerotinia borealis (strain F-4128) TaxID=1432307 RepID=W9CJQ9_SCLBF|nr:hypothetical protein SBOR_3495 [Sclerotinia borealis F-4128]
MDSPQKLMENYPPGTPLHQVSPERINQQKQWDLPQSPTGEKKASKHSRDSSVNDKIAQFNSLAYQSKQLERKTNDAALKRAMVGREEAESEMRRYRDEARILRRQMEEGKERERKVGERLESVMENYGRAKETHSHTQALWEKEIRRARKEGFKSQSVVVKVQEELKASRDTLRMVQGGLEQEKDRSSKREQEAFSAKYQLVRVQDELVEVQEELVRLQERIQVVEQERDLFKTIAKNEEFARIAAEGRIQSPQSTKDDKISSPKKVRRSIDTFAPLSSPAVQEELDDLRLKLEWEIQRANRGLDQVEFLEMESSLHVCDPKSNKRKSTDTQELYDDSTRQAKAPRTSTVFVPSEGIFKSVPEESSNSMEDASSKSDTHFEKLSEYSAHPQRAVTPSYDPPAVALMSGPNTSLLSIFDEVDSPKTTRSLRSPINLPEAKVDDETNPEDLNGSSSITIHHPHSHQHHHEPTFHTVSTTTRVPLADPSEDQAHATTPKTPTASTPPNNNNTPALGRTVSREEALAMIQERRGRARSLANGTMTPRKQMVEGGNRRDISAPAGGLTPGRGRSNVKSR